MPPDPHKQQRARDANRVRSARGQLRRGVKAGTIDPVALLRGEGPDSEAWEFVVRTTKIEEFLLMVQGFGPQSVDEFLMHVGLSRRAVPRDMTYKQRGELADLLALATASSAPVPDPINP